MCRSDRRSGAQAFAIPLQFAPSRRRFLRSRRDDLPSETGWGVSLNGTRSRFLAGRVSANRTNPTARNPAGPLAEFRHPISWPIHRAFEAAHDLALVSNFL